MGYKQDPDYIEVPERIKAFYKAYPEGRLICNEPPIGMKFGDREFIAVHARAFRTPDDPLPGDGWAWEPVPGTTPFTQNSELMNAQTAAIGRAIVSVGMLASRKIASAEEVRNRKAEGEIDPKAEHRVLDTITDEEVAKLEPLVRDWLKANDDKREQLKVKLVSLGVIDPELSLDKVLGQIPNSKKAADLMKWLGKNDKSQLSGDDLADKLIEEGVAVEAA